MSTNLVEIKNVSKSFPGTLANDKVSFNIRSNSVHALLGENGAGKSTLVKILYGILEHDSGEIIFDNDKFSIKKRYNVDIMEDCLIYLGNLNLCLVLKMLKIFHLIQTI